MGGHHLKVPAVAKKLTYRTLWTTLAIKQGRIFFVFVEVRRKNYPNQHLFAIGGRYPSFFRFAKSHIFQYFTVGKGKLFFTAIGFNPEYFRGQIMTHLSDDQVISIQGKSLNIVVALGELSNFTGSKIYTIHLVGCMNAADEIKLLSVRAELKTGRTLVKAF